LEVTLSRYAALHYGDQKSCGPAALLNHLDGGDHYREWDSNSSGLSSKLKLKSDYFASLHEYFGVLKAAEFDNAEINDVPMSSLHGLHHRRGLAYSHATNFKTLTSQGPGTHIFHGVKLTTAGMRAARGLQGLPNLPPAPAR
jgi:hypothetical protein